MCQNCAEISFEDLTKDPKGSIRKIYSQFGFDSFDAQVKSSYPQQLDEECEELRGYERNKFKKVILDDKLKETVKQRWRKQFDILGYSDVYPSDQML